MNSAGSAGTLQSLDLNHTEATGTTARETTHMATKLPQGRFFHSTLNRQRDHRRIEQENLALIKRLDSTKPTPSLIRSEQLKDYLNNTKILGAASYPGCMSTNMSEQSTSQTPSADPWPASSTHHSYRAIYTSTFSTTPRSKKQPRADWC
ncbi:hypothetical protein VZT92_003232 [Zoarces viviparus]|uniref:Cilia- and flagella-associated protein 97 n=1 Tax=Zoarces viviparus TaxID=48416 RepID=A0AAW1G3N8_ZOAVI